MRNFLRNILYLSIPFVLYILIIAAIDPFQYLSFSRMIDPGSKERISPKVSPHLYRILDIRNNPRANVVFGDSRMAALYRKMDSEKWGSLAFEGGSLKETIQAFDWIAQKQEIDTIIIQVSPNQYNLFNKRFHVEEALESLRNFLSYAATRNVFRASFLILKDAVSNDEVRINEVNMTQEEFWQQHLNTKPEHFFKRWGYPEEYKSGLERIATFCDKNGIVLIFWIPPSHMDYQKEIAKYNAEEIKRRMIEDLKYKAILFDYDFENELTRNRASFKDPVHFTPTVATQIISEIQIGSSSVAKVFSYDKQ